MGPLPELPPLIMTRSQSWAWGSCWVMRAVASMRVSGPLSAWMRPTNRTRRWLLLMPSWVRSWCLRAWSVG